MVLKVTRIPRHKVKKAPTMIMLGVRFEEAFAAKIIRLSEKSGKSISQVLRDLVRKGLKAS